MGPQLDDNLNQFLDRDLQLEAYTATGVQLVHMPHGTYSVICPCNWPSRTVFQRRKLRLVTQWVIPTNLKLGHACMRNGYSCHPNPLHPQLTDDEEALQEEEEEVERLERKKAKGLMAQDFGLDDSDSAAGTSDEGNSGSYASDSASDGEDVTLGKQVAANAAANGTKGGRKGAAGANGAAARDSKGRKGGGGGRRVEVEAVAKDLSGLTSDEKLSAIMGDAPELVALMADLQESLAEVRWGAAD